MNKNQTYILHDRQRDESGEPVKKGGTTLVYRIGDDGIITVGGSICSKNDTYDKKKGVNRALSRLLSNDDILPGVMKINLVEAMFESIEHVSSHNAYHLLVSGLDQNPADILENPIYKTLLAATKEAMIAVVTDPSNVRKNVVDLVVKSEFQAHAAPVLNRFSKANKELDNV